MTNFEFAFSLFGLVLGLALAEVLAGFARVVKARSVRKDREIALRFGWQTPLLALLVALDLISFWFNLWGLRDVIPATLVSLILGAAFIGIYYVAASLIFPDDAEAWPDLDDWFARHKSMVAAGIVLANLGSTIVFIYWAGLRSHEWLHAVPILQFVYIALAASLIFTRKEWQSLAALVLLLLLIAWYASALPVI